MFSSAGNDAYVRVPSMSENAQMSFTSSSGGELHLKQNILRKTIFVATVSITKGFCEVV